MAHRKDCSMYCEEVQLLSTFLPFCFNNVQASLAFETGPQPVAGVLPYALTGQGDRKKCVHVCVCVCVSVCVCVRVLRVCVCVHAYTYMHAHHTHKHTHALI